MLSVLILNLFIMSVITLLNDEIHALERGYNPRKKAIAADCTEYDHTLESALLFALEKKKLEPETKRVVRSRLNLCLAEAKKLHYSAMPIANVRRRHIINILDNFKDNVHNECRARLKLLFKELVKREIIESNPVDEFAETRQVVRKLKKLLTPDERQKLYSLKETHYTFWRYINIFFHSSRRNTEMLSIKKEHVDLHNQKFQVLQKKGKKTKWVWVTIENNAMHFWEEIMSEAKQDDWYLFAENLRPGKRDKPIRTDQIKRRWQMYVRDKLGIKQGFYILKHSHLDEIAEKKGIEAAQMSAGHSSKVVTMMYAIGESDREHERKKAKESKL